MVNHRNRGAASDDRHYLRKAYGAFRSGAGLRNEDVERLLAKAGYPLSSNRLRELGRDSDRAASITTEELWALISTWAEERQATRPTP